MGLRAVFFDMGDTLVSERRDVGDPWREPVLAAIQRELGPRAWAETLYAADIRRPPVDDPHRQETNRWLAEWLRERGELLGDDEVERLRIAFARPLPAIFSLAAGALESLRWCKARGLAVLVLTNTLSRGDAEARGDFERFGVSDLIDEVITSYSTGWQKPHPAMFERALRHATVSATEACMVGDRLDFDVAGPKALGIRAVWRSHALLPPGFVPPPDATIRSLEELPTVLESWL
ncbi:MAG TPA: HAD family hydrolase [Candidatus Limnocylindria bacterium]|nr:HAD family hydrolase [Candidatus Limnocylindria bacterium]